MNYMNCLSDGGRCVDLLKKGLLPQLEIIYLSVYLQ
jgi:hypothetical protein